MIQNEFFTAIRFYKMDLNKSDLPTDMCINKLYETISHHSLLIGPRMTISFFILKKNESLSTD
jgi:hypothetical protein